MVEISRKIRRKREERRHFVGRVRGQTQSQYLAFGSQGGQPGKAEAESSLEGTKAVVSMYRPYNFTIHCSFPTFYTGRLELDEFQLGNSLKCKCK